MTLKELKKCRYGLTHDGIFHADDVFSTAFIKIINPRIKIIRKNKVPERFCGIIYDIGNTEFDHHNSDNDYRENGIPYASFGKLWRKFAKELYGDYVYRKVDKKLIEFLDLADNTGQSDTLSLAISTFNPKNVSLVEKNFRQAVDFAKIILQNLINNEKSNLSDTKLVEEIYNNANNKKIIVLSKYLYFKDALCDKETIYVIYPSVRGGYLAQSLSISSDVQTLKKPFPQRWVKKLPEYLTFCHKSRFLIGANNLDNILYACNIALKEDLNDRK